MAAPVWARGLRCAMTGQWRMKDGAVPRVLCLPTALDKAAQSVMDEEGWSPVQAQMLGTQFWGQRPPEQEPGPKIRFTAELARAYLAVRLRRDHAAVGRALQEIQLRVPTFAPQTVLDYGNGIGTACWAAHELWGGSVRHYVCVGPSRAMRDMGERLRHGGANSGPAHFGPVFTRPTLTAQHKAPWDLVVCSYILGGTRGRGGVIRGLWRRSREFMVLVEAGTRTGHSLLMEARDELLQGPDKDTVQIFAPCPHHHPCPRLLHNKSCSFAQSFQDPPGHSRELFSFLIARRVTMTSQDESAMLMTSQGGAMTSQGGAMTSQGGAMTSQGGAMTSSRVTAPVRPRPGHVPLSLCCPNGVLKRVTVTAARHGRPLYRQARTSRWGDLLPFPYDVSDDVTP